MKRIIVFVLSLLVLPVLIQAFSIEKVMNLAGETREIRAVAFSPDGSNIATVGGENRLKIWNPVSGTVTADAAAHTDKINTVCYSPDGKSIITGSDDDSIKFWDAKTGGMTKEIKTGSNVRSLRFSPDGKSFAVGSEFRKNVEIYSYPSCVTIKAMDNSNPIIAFSGDGKYLAGTESSYGLTKIWNTADGLTAFKIEAPGAAVGVEFSPDNKYLLVCGYKTPGSYTTQGYFNLYETAGFTQVFSQQVTKESTIHLNFAKYSPDGSFFVAGDSIGNLAAYSFDGKAINRLWSMDMAHDMSFFSGSQAILDAAFSRDGKYLVTSADNWKNSLILWKVTK